jgi:hypothetical protein
MPAGRHAGERLRKTITSVLHLLFLVIDCEPSHAMLELE